MGTMIKRLRDKSIEIERKMQGYDQIKRCAILEETLHFEICKTITEIEKIIIKGTNKHGIPIENIHKAIDFINEIKKEQ